MVQMLCSTGAQIALAVFTELSHKKIGRILGFYPDSEYRGIKCTQGAEMTLYGALRTLQRHSTRGPQRNLAGNTVNFSPAVNADDVVMVRQH